MANSKQKNLGGRPKKTTTIIQKAVENRSLEDLYWAFLSHSVHELRQDGELKTFSGNHIVSMLDSLQKLDAAKGADSKEQINEVKDWLKKAG
jgi:hypothetical protein